VLAVIQYEEEPPTSQRRHERGQQRLLRGLSHTQDRRDLMCDESGVSQRAELDQPYAVGVVLDLDKSSSHFKGKPRLAAAADAGQCQQARTGQTNRDLGELLLSTDEATERGGQVVLSGTSR